MGAYVEELKNYIPVANALAKTFGKHCEVVLHDLSSPQSSVIYTVNSHVTGRAVGQSFNHLITQVLLSQKLRNDVVANYRTETADGRTIKSSTALIRNGEGETIGAFCLNIDIQPLLDSSSFVHELTRMEEERVKGAEIEVVQNVWEIVEQLIGQLVAEKDVEKIEKQEKLQMVHFLDRKGVFLIKGALEKVAAELNISKVTLYSYLDEIRRSQRQEEYC